MPSHILDDIEERDVVKKTRQALRNAQYFLTDEQKWLCANAWAGQDNAAIARSLGCGRPPSKAVALLAALPDGVTFESVAPILTGNIAAAVAGATGGGFQVGEETSASSQTRSFLDMLVSDGRATPEEAESVWSELSGQLANIDGPLTGAIFGTLLGRNASLRLLLMNAGDRIPGWRGRALTAMGIALPVFGALLGGGGGAAYEALGPSTPAPQSGGGGEDLP